MDHVKAYEGLRALLAIWVLLGHWGTAIAWPVHRIPANLWNVRAVDVFIVLSGFAIATLLDRKGERYWPYILRRFLRIFPVYWFYLLLSIATIGLAYAVWSTPGPGAMQDFRARIAADSIANFWPHLLIHIPAAHALVPEALLPLSAFAFLGQAWSISLEWQFYLVAPFAIGALLLARRDWRLALGLAVMLLLLRVAARWMPMGFIGGYSELFAIGIGTYYLLRARRDGAAWANAIPMLPATIAAAGLLLLLGSPHAAPLAIWVVVTGAVCLGAEASPLRPVTAFLGLPLVQNLGKMSYSIYLSHMLVLTVGLYLLDRLGIESRTLGAALLLAFTLAGTWLLSTASYRLIERPFQQLGRRLSEGRAAAATVRAAAASE